MIIRTNQFTEGLKFAKTMSLAQLLSIGLIDHIGYSFDFISLCANLVSR